MNGKVMIFKPGNDMLVCEMEHATKQLLCWMPKGTWVYFQAFNRWWLYGTDNSAEPKEIEHVPSALRLLALLE